MDSIKLAYRNLFRRKQNNFIKIISLGTGLAVGLVLLSKVSFERNYDDFYPDRERIYRIETTVVQNDEPKEYGQVSGAVAPGMKAEVPGVEVATRFTWLGSDETFMLDKKRYKGEVIMADEYLFDIFPRPMIAGNAKETLSRSMYTLVSHSLAKKMGGDVMGKILQSESIPGMEIIIGGIFEDIPENSYNRYDIIVSLESIKQFMWDGRDNWVGNDRYYGYVKLQPGIAPESLAPAIRQMQEKNQPMEEMRKSGVELSYGLVPLTTLHSNSRGVKDITLILSIIALSLLLTTVLNYLLIVITALMHRGKEFAVNKCYGASGTNIIRLISAETLLHFAIALLLAAALLIFFKSSVEEILGASLPSLFSQKALLLLTGVLAVIFVVAVVIPANTLQRIPLAAVFYRNRRAKKGWKLALLFVQFTAAAFLVVLTASIGKQYRFVVNSHPGYDYRNVAFAGLKGVDSLGKQTLENELSRLPDVEHVSLVSELPIFYMSGNNVTVEGNDRELFNIADMYYADEHFLPLMNIPVVAGKNFDAQCNVRNALVSELFAERMKTLLGWDDVVGRDVIITEHGLTHIVGVFSNIRIASLVNPDTRPAALFYSARHPQVIRHYQNNLLVKFKKLDAKSMAAVNAAIERVLPERELSFVPYAESMVKSYEKARLFRDAITTGAIITLLISLIGLIGYVNSEISHRTAEIAIRKINGATLTDILRIFAGNILYIALPAIIAGCVATRFANTIWMENFSERSSFGVWEYLACALLLLLLIEATVIVNCIRTAGRNPVDSLKKDI